MSRTLSFAEILEREMAVEPAPNKGDLATDNGSGAPQASGSTPISTTPKTTEVSPEAFSFDWSRVVKTKLHGAYDASSPARPTSATRVAAPALRLRPETEWAINDLSTVARLALEKLYIESNSLTRSLVKRAYRRLAKRLHPDVATKATAASCEAFLLVQEAYDVVMRELDELEKRSGAADKHLDKSEKKAA